MATARGAADLQTAKPALPRWAHTADFIVLFLVVLAAIIAISGGVRVRTETWRVTITSPLRLLAWAAAVGLIRHGLTRQVPIYQHLGRTIALTVSSAPFRAATTTFVATRLIIFLVGYLAVATIGYPTGVVAPGDRNSSGALANLPLRWDAGWYLRVAQNGYEYSPAIGANGQQSVVFFPAFPLTIRLVAVVFGGGKNAYVLAGTVVSLSAFLGALVYVYLIARRYLEDEESRLALWLLATFPFAYFYGAIYTEGLFLLGTAGAFYHAGDRQHRQAAMWGLLAGLTKPNGFLLTVPLAILAVSPLLPRWLVAGPGPTENIEGRPDSRAAVVSGLIAATSPVLGMLAFSAFIWRLTGSPWAWAEGHAAWGRHYTGLSVLIADRYNWIATEGVTGYLSQVPLDFLNAVGVVFVLATVWPVSRRLGLAYAIFILLSLMPALAGGGMLSAGRLSSVLFPAFIWLAGAVPSSHRPGWIASFAANQALNASLFYTWRQLF